MIQEAVGALNIVDPEERARALDDAELELAKANYHYRPYVDRAALLGPEFGGTVKVDLP